VPEIQNDDPIVAKSYSGPLLVASLLLVLSMFWALWQEFVGLRPWRGYQREFASVYEQFLKKELTKQTEAAKVIQASAEYQKLAQAAKEASDAAAPQVKEIDEQVAYISRRVTALSPTFITARGQVTALIYQVEIAPSESSKKSRNEDVDKTKKGPFNVELPTADGKTEKKSFDYDHLLAEFDSLKAQKASLTLKRAAARKAADEAAKAVTTHFQEHLDGLTADQVNSLRTAVQQMKVSIRQIDVSDAGLVDRCQSCHVGMDAKLVPPALELTKASLGLEKSKNAPFTSHPQQELLKIHPTEKFGCSPCHGGNGRATNSVIKGHGRNEFWLWPLYYKENTEAGCQTCHASDMYTYYAPVLNRGRELYRQKGCIGCHRYEGFDNEGEQLLSARQKVRQLEQQRVDDELEIPRLNKLGDQAPDNKAAQDFYAKAENMRVQTSLIDAQVEQLMVRARSLLREEKKVGPSLKEAKMKLRKEWIYYWLENTHTFRPDTKMPQFRFKAREPRAISAFIWQMAVAGPALKPQPSGNAAKGKESFESRGCLACHSIGEGNKKMGGTFAANLSRVGEKVNYDYLVRWIHNPRERTRPYDPVERKDLGPEDYSQHGKPFVFDLENSRSPDGKHELQVQQQTVMPNLRLTIEEARDIASYLMTQKHADAVYRPTEFMDDTKLADQGRALVKNYGCAGCHEIATLEEEGRIGTELTTEGSKPIERLDFSLLTEHAKRGIQPDGKPNERDGEKNAEWYDLKGFFEHKLANSAIYDQGRFTTQLKMPQPSVTPEDVTALTTFLLGSVDPQVPKNYMYKPADQRRDIQEGWWLVTKYNCMGCHQVAVGQQSSLQGNPLYQAENKFKLPPPLLSEGARVNPNWLARFLENPAMSTSDLNRNGVRSYLAVRMPTFSFSDGEIRKIVKFFQAVATQAQPFLPPKLEPLTPQERAMARDLFTHPAAPCLKCHATGQAAHDVNASAPNFLLAPDRLQPAWMARWITEPARISPGTAMPSGLFKKEGGRWVFSGPLPPSLQGYSKDHADLLVRYMFQITPEEQRMLLGRSPSGGKPGAK
jgi:mono/diheme cytochrome c family protein